VRSGWNWQSLKDITNWHGVMRFRYAVVIEGMAICVLRLDHPVVIEGMAICVLGLDHPVVIEGMGSTVQVFFPIQRMQNHPSSNSHRTQMSESHHPWHILCNK
jgi:hypothetical protein